MKNTKILDENVDLSEFGDCFLDLTKDKYLNLPNLSFDHLYIKIKHLDVECLMERELNPQIYKVVLEIVDIQPEKKVNINETIRKLGIQRVVLKFIIKSAEQLRNYNVGLFSIIEKIHIDNLCIDFYFDYSTDDATEDIKNILKQYPQIKHFSIYFTENLNRGMLVPPIILNFRRYHKHMWALDDYHSTFQITTTVTKNYLGIGRNTISRSKNNFYSCVVKENGVDWRLIPVKGFTNQFVNFNDHIDRLSFYYKLPPRELTKYQKITRYDDLFVKYENDIYIVHDAIIAELIDEME